MNISGPAIERPVATFLLTIALLLAGGLAYTQLPVSPLPQIDFPVISERRRLLSMISRACSLLIGVPSTSWNS